MFQPFGSDYKPLELKNDINIVSKALAFVMDIDKALKLDSLEKQALKLESLEDQNLEDSSKSESLVVHQIAGPPYFENEPKLPNSKETRKTGAKRRNKTRIATTTTTTTQRPKFNKNNRRLRRQRLKMRILKQLRRMQKQEQLSEKISSQSTKNYPIDRTGNVIGRLTGDLSMSRTDFAVELIKWFRRSIWFLAFTAASTQSPTLLLVTVS